jgi:hypothetical protein
MTLLVGFNESQETALEESKEDEMDSQAEVQSQSQSKWKNAPGDKTKKVDASEKKWKIVFGLLVLAIIGVIGAAVAVGVSRDDGASPPPTSLTIEPTAVTAAQTMPVNDPQDQLTILRQGLQANSITAGYLDLIPTDAESLKGKFSNQDEDAVARAASWLVHEDPLNEKSQLLARFALAVIYLQTGGAAWTNSTNWLSGDSICVWYGVRCGDPGHPSDHVLADKVRELDLERNNLEGQLPESIAMLREMRVLWLNRNSLSGLVPDEALGSLPVLLILHLDSNQFTGPIPTSLRNNGILGTLTLVECLAFFVTHISNRLTIPPPSHFCSTDTLYVHGNNFTGDWPLSYCAPCNKCDHPFREFGLDCAKNSISPRCHESRYHCFY